MLLAAEEHRKMSDELNHRIALTRRKVLQTRVQRVVRQTGGSGKDAFMHDRL
jgi:hypothetical protein